MGYKKENENGESAQTSTSAKNTSELAGETIEQEAEISHHSNANNLSGAATENIDDNTTDGTVKGINNDR